MTRPTWLGRAARNRHRHAIEQASRRWRGGRRDSARTRRKILISTQAQGLPEEGRRPEEEEPEERRRGDVRYSEVALDAAGRRLRRVS